MGGGIQSRHILPAPICTKTPSMVWLLRPWGLGGLESRLGASEAIPGGCTLTGDIFRVCRGLLRLLNVRSIGVCAGWAGR